MMTPFVTRAEAHKKKTHHQFVPGMGYLSHAGAPELPPGANGSKNCAPPEDAKDGSLHALRPPGGHPPMNMLWVAGERAWAHPVPGSGNRLAWPVEHLMRAGWEYIEPVKAKAKRA